MATCCGNSLRGPGACPKCGKPNVGPVTVERERCVVATANGGGLTEGNQYYIISCFIKEEDCPPSDVLEVVWGISEGKPIDIEDNAQYEDCPPPGDSTVVVDFTELIASQTACWGASGGATIKELLQGILDKPDVEFDYTTNLDAMAALLQQILDKPDVEFDWTVLLESIRDNIIAEGNETQALLTLINDCLGAPSPETIKELLALINTSINTQHDETQTYLGDGSQLPPAVDVDGNYDLTATLTQTELLKMAVDKLCQIKDKPGGGGPDYTALLTSIVDCLGTPSPETVKELLALINAQHDETQTYLGDGSQPPPATDVDGNYDLTGTFTQTELLKAQLDKLCQIKDKEGGASASGGAVVCNTAGDLVLVCKDADGNAAEVAIPGYDPIAQKEDCTTTFETVTVTPGTPSPIAAPTAPAGYTLAGTNYVAPVCPTETTTFEGKWGATDGTTNLWYDPGQSLSIQGESTLTDLVATDPDSNPVTVILTHTWTRCISIAAPKEAA